MKRGKEGNVTYDSRCVDVERHRKRDEETGETWAYGSRSAEKKRSVLIGVIVDIDDLGSFFSSIREPVWPVRYVVEGEVAG